MGIVIKMKIRFRHTDIDKHTYIQIEMRIGIAKSIYHLDIHIHIQYIDNDIFINIHICIGYCE